MANGTMGGGGLKPPTAIEEGKSGSSGGQNQPPADLNKLLSELMEKSGSQGGDGQEGVGQGKSGSGTSQKTLSPEERKRQEEQRRKKAELEARLKQIIARYNRIQEEIKAYRKRKAQEEEKKRLAEEQEKERKKKEEEAKKRQTVRLPESPKKGILARFLGKLSSGGEQGRLKE